MHRIFSQISDEWVMTAAHCVDGATSMKVFLGAHNVREDEEVISKMSEQFLTFEARYLHKGYCQLVSCSLIYGTRSKKGTWKTFYIDKNCNLNILLGYKVYVTEKRTYVNRGCNLKTSHLLMVLLSIPLDKSP